MGNLKKAESENPFNVPYTLGEFINRLVVKFEHRPSKLYTDKQVIQFAEEVSPEICNQTQEEMIKRKAMECLTKQLILSFN